MNCPWFSNKVFFISTPGVVLPCCSLPIFSFIVPEQEERFHEKYKMLYLKHDAIENIVENKTLMIKLIYDCMKNNICQNSLCSQCNLRIDNIGKNLLNFQIMLTTNCSLRCLACVRNADPISRNYIDNHHWNFELDEFKKQFNPEFLQKVNSIQFTGTSGDAIFYKPFLSLLRYISTYNNKIFITIHTNGNYRNRTWWIFLQHELSRFEDYNLVFAIDGLETYPIYRVNGKLDLVLQNAQTFINAGGKAVWKYVRMKHNEHETEQAEQLSKKMGFHEFRINNAWRVHTSHEIYNRNNIIS